MLHVQEPVWRVTVFISDPLKVSLLWLALILSNYPLRNQHIQGHYSPALASSKSPTRRWHYLPATGNLLIRPMVEFRTVYPSFFLKPIRNVNDLLRVLLSTGALRVDESQKNTVQLSLTQCVLFASRWFKRKFLAYPYKPCSPHSAHKSSPCMAFHPLLPHVWQPTRVRGWRLPLLLQKSKLNQLSRVDWNYTISYSYISSKSKIP